MMPRIVVATFLVVVVGGMFALGSIATDGRDDAPPPPAVRVNGSAAQLTVLEQTVRDRPDDVDALTRLASLYVQRDAADQALAVEPDAVRRWSLRASWRWRGTTSPAR